MNIRNAPYACDINESQINPNLGQGQRYHIIILLLLMR